MSDVEMLISIKLKIKKFLKDKKYKQNILCDVLGYGKTTITALLSGGRDIEIVEYKKICDYFGLPLDYFLKETTNV